MPFKKKDGPSKIQERVNEIAKWLTDKHPEILREQRQANDGSSERGYYMFGYMMALKDVLEILDRIGIKWTLD